MIDLARYQGEPEIAKEGWFFDEDGCMFRTKDNPGYPAGAEGPAEMPPCVDEAPVVAADQGGADQWAILKELFEDADAGQLSEAPYPGCDEGIVEEAEPAVTVEEDLLPAGNYPEESTAEEAEPAEAGEGPTPSCPHTPGCRGNHPNHSRFIVCPYTGKSYPADDEEETEPKPPSEPPVTSPVESPTPPNPSSEDDASHPQANVDTTEYRPTDAALYEFDRIPF